jgi:hypothetical protein
MGDWLGDERRCACGVFGFPRQVKNVTLRGMNAAYLRKAIAVASIIFGLCWLWQVVVCPTFRFAAQGKSPSQYLFYVPMFLLVGMPSVLCSYFGFKLFREMSETNLRWVLGTFAVVAAFWIAARFSAVYPSLLPESLLHSVGLTLGILIALPAYLFLLRVLLPMLGRPRCRAMDFVGRGILLVLAWDLWLLLEKLFHIYSPLEPGSKYVHQEPWQSVGYIVPALVAYGFFRAAQSLLSRRRNREETQAPQVMA